MESLGRHRHDTWRKWRGPLLLGHDGSTIEAVMKGQYNLVYFSNRNYAPLAIRPDAGRGKYKVVHTVNLLD